MKDDSSADKSLITGIIKAEKKRITEYKRRLEIRISRAKAEAERLTEAFRKADPELELIILFGSLAEGRVSSEFFDIDLAVISDKYLQLVSLGLDSDFKVDVVELEALPKAYKDRIIERGLILYESHSP